MSYPGRVRIADKSDEEELMSLCRQLHAENGLFTLNEDKVRATLHSAFNREGGILGVIGDAGKIESMILMIVGYFWYSDEPHLEELYAFTSPPFRKTKNSVELIEFAKWASDVSGFPLVIGVMSNERTAAKVRLYQRKLQAPIGNFFWYKGSGDVKVANGTNR
jgi:hypothetical protein